MEEENVTSEYFGLIYKNLSSIRCVVRWSVEVWSQFELLEMDFRFLESFCLCLESWNYTIDDEDLMETIRSMITTLSVIWPNEHKGLYLLNGLVRQSWTADIQDFRSAIVEFDPKIQQSKKEIERWCGNLMRSPMQKCKSSTIAETRSVLQQVQMNLGFFSCYIADDIVPLEKQINFLEAKIEFLDDKLKKIEGCTCTKEIIQFVNFIRGFINKAMCLACFYWAKEANEEIENEMNIVLFDWLQKFIPFAYDITPLYVGILKSGNLQPSEALESFVDFFFQHLSTTLKDDFHILRDRLIFLFTFLTDPPCENEKEEDLIRNQIYALLHEDSYLLLPFDEMKDDFSNNKMLLSECLIKIDTAIFKIRQLYCGFSDSWIRLEVEKMDYIYFVSVHRELSSIEKHAEWADQVRDQLQLYKMELRFLKVFLYCFMTWDDSDEEIKVRLSSIIASLQGIWGTKEENGLLAPRLHAICSVDITYWHPLAFDLEGKIMMSKLEIKQWCLDMFHLSFRCQSSTTYKKILMFLDSILENLNDLVNFRAGEIIPFKKKIETLEEKLIFLKNFLTLIANCVHGKDSGKFKMFVQAFAIDAAQLTFLYWAKDANDNITSATNSLFSHALERIKPSTRDVARLYFKTLEAIYVQQSDSIIFGQTALSFVDFFFEDSVPYLSHDFQILRDDIVFLLTFLNDHSNENANGLIFEQIDVLFWEGLFDLLPFDDMEKDESKKKVILSDFMMKIETVNSNIRHIYCKFPDSTLYNFPKDVSQGFLDFLIQNLENLKERMISDRKYVPFAKYKIIQIEEELISLCPFFNYIFGFKSDQNETWLEVANLLYLTEYIISSCISSWFVFHHPIWHHIAYLSHIFDKTKVVKTRLEKFKANTIYKARCLPNPVGSISTPTEIIEIFVGFEDDAKTIAGMLTRGTMSLDIVSIVGMGGLGKTTLAKKVSSLVKGDFTVFAFCSVSQVQNTRGLLIDILHDIIGDDKRNFDKTDDDLAHQLRKSLSRRRYLIVLDDIWSESAWIDVKSSFPDDKNGSRVMFTTRSYKFADKCKINCTPHQLRFFSEVESWELLQKKVFDNGISPPYLHEFGKMIAKNCKGLPLAVAIIAGLLARTEKTQRWWSEVLENVVSYADEGCMKILELSYMHLPENLKPCLIYLGVFPEDMLIRVKQVILLWIAEGFVQGSKTKNIEDVAKEYFHDLVDRNLIIVTEKSSSGEIKSFRVHDLIHDLCQIKCADGNFFHINHGITSSSSSDPSINNHYCVSTNNKRCVLIAQGSSVTNTRSLLFFDDNYDSVRLHFEFPYAQVLDVGFIGKLLDKQLTSMLHLRHINACLNVESNPLGPIIISSSISNLWNIGSLILDTVCNEVYIPESFWKLKSLRHVKVNRCVIQFPDGHEHDTYSKLVKVVSFSNIILSTGKDVPCLLQRLPAVRKLSCCLKDSFENGKESSDTLDFFAELESLTLSESVFGRKSTRSIQFPPSLKKLHLNLFKLPWMAMSNIAELNCLVVLKLGDISFPEPRLEMEDLVFPNLKYIALYSTDFVEWNASGESLPVVEQLILIFCKKLKDLPSCFEELSTLKRIVIRYSPEALENSALKIREEQKDQGNEVEVSIENVPNKDVGFENDI